MHSPSFDFQFRNLKRKVSQNDLQTVTKKLKTESNLPFQNNPLQINELLSLILTKLPWNTLVGLRSICKHWKVAIDAISKRTQCLVITRETETFPVENRSFGSTLKLGQSIEFKVGTYIDGKYIAEQFPNVHQLVIRLNPEDYLWKRLDEEDTASDICEMLQSHLPNLTTLSLSAFARNSKAMQTCCDGINSLKSLRNLHLSGDLVEGLPSAEVFHNLEHFSSNHFESSNLRLPELGPNCASLWFEMVEIGKFNQWVQSNASQLGSQVTHLGFSLTYGTNWLMSSICGTFSSLRVLHLSSFNWSPMLIDSAACEQLAKLTNLRTLRICHAHIDVDSFESCKLTLPSIQVFHLTNFYVGGEEVETENVGQLFSQHFSSLLPNLEVLGVCSTDLYHEVSYENCPVFDEIGKHLKYFGTKLRRYVKLSSVIESY